MASAVFMATALAVAANPSLAPAGDTAGTVGVLHQLSTANWCIGALFFGLWLIPMGWAAITSGRFPTTLGWLLWAGGVGYVLSSFADYGLANGPNLLVDALAFPATIAEFWMIGYLLTRGIRPQTRAAQPTPETTVPTRHNPPDCCDPLTAACRRAGCPCT